METLGFVPMISTTTRSFSSSRSIRESIFNSQRQEKQTETISQRKDIQFMLYSSKGSSNKNDYEEGDQQSTGMEEAFASLNELKSLDDNISMTSPLQSAQESMALDSDTQFDLTQDEFNMYKDMYEELEKGDGNEIYGNILDELTGSSTSSATDSNTDRDTRSKANGLDVVVPLDDVDGIGSIQDSLNKVRDDSSSSDIEEMNVVELSQDTDKFMRRALEEALDEAKVQGGGSLNDVDDESILNDEEFMKEINAVFDRANEKLLESIATIKKEQDQLSKASAQDRSRVLDEDEARLRDAESSVARLVDKVKQETLEVERAVKELQQAQEQFGGDPLTKAADLKKAGIVKQGALVGAILFSFRSVGELLLVAQQQGGTGDVEGHSVAAAIQALIALACGGYLVFF